MSYSRLHFLDNLRTILTTLGILLHASNIYSPDMAWVIKSTESSVALQILGEFIHLFRMPAFFLVSGYFCAMGLSKLSNSEFIRRRALRIGLPLISTALLVNSMQTLLLAKTGWLHFNLQTYINDGQWTSHLWFLINLLVYFALACTFRMLMPQHVHKALIKAIEFLARWPLLLLVPMLAVSNVAVYALNTVGFPLYGKLGGFLSLYFVVLYLPFFGVGLALFAVPILLERILNSHPWPLILFALIAYGYNTFPEVPHEVWQPVRETMTEGLWMWSLALLCLNLSARTLSKHSPMLSSLAQASYTIYLLHHLLVIFLGLICIQLNLPWWLGFPLLVASVYLASYQIHIRLVQPWPIGRRLFNGK